MPIGDGGDLHKPGVLGHIEGSQNTPQNAQEIGGRDMTNIRPVQLTPPRWPWKNQIMNGFPTVVEREAQPWMPDLVSCYNWDMLEEIEIPLPLEGTCSRDMKSVFTTAVRMYGYEELYVQLLSGNNVFGFVGNEFVRWERRLREMTRIDYVVIGDDIAHNENLFFPPNTLSRLLDVYEEIIWAAHATAVFHSDGHIEPIFDELCNIFDYFLIQKKLNPTIDGPNIFDNDEPESGWESYPTREM
jgi:hypothetical protein